MKFNFSTLKLLVVLTVVGFVVTACPIITDPLPLPPKVLKPSLNVMMLLDLSDRLILQSGQPSRDTELVNFICREMPKIIRDNNGPDKSKETVKIQVAYQNNIPYSNVLRQYSDSLSFRMSKEVRGGIPEVRKIFSGRFPRNIERLYKDAVFSTVPEDYSGANLSRYFIQDLKNDMQSDSMTNNILFILTDGYVVVGQEKNAMLDVHSKFPDLSIMVLEIAPRNEDYESERLQQSWDEWFAQMDVKGYTIRYNTGTMDALKLDISEFLRGSLVLNVPGRFSSLPPVHYNNEVQVPEISSLPPVNNEMETKGKSKPIEKGDQQISIPESATLKSQTILYPNGDIYIGEVKNGKPDGLGTFTFKNSRQIFEDDIYNQKAEAGDMIMNGTWRNGVLQMGRLYNSRQEFKYTITIGG